MSKRLQFILVGLVCFLLGALVTQSVFVYGQSGKTKEPVWLHGLELRVRKAGEADFGPNTKKWGLEVTVPEEYLGAVTADLNARRADIKDLLTRGNLRIIEAEVPLARMFDYTDRVRSLTQGRAGWTMEPAAYREAPPEVLHALLHPEEVY